MTADKPETGENKSTNTKGNAAKSPAGRRPHDGGANAKSIEKITKDDIIAVATAEFARVGFDGASVNAIARKTKTSKMMIYYHFGNKPGLYRAVLEASYDRIVQQRPGDSLRQMAPTKALATYAKTVFDVHLNHPDFVRLVMGENLNDAKFIQDSTAVRARTKLNMGTLENIVSRGIDTKEFRADCDAASLYLVISGLCFQAVSNAATLKFSVGLDLDQKEVQDYRRNLTAEVALRYAGADHMG